MVQPKTINKKKKNSDGIIKRLVKYAIVTTLILGIFGVCALAGAFMYFSKELPKLDKLSDYQPKLKTMVYSADDVLIGEFYDENREWVEPDEIPQYLIDAVVATEDKNFYKHNGIDYVGILRAAWANIKAGGVREGASTITQQVAKTFLLTSERRFKRKFREIILARRIEKGFSKKEIMHLYLSQIFFGHNSYGIKTAARSYFGKEVKDLNIAECALLAGLPQAPSAHSPLKNPERAKKRQRHVLKRMKAEGYITDEQYEQALEYDYESQLVRFENVSRSRTPYFTEEVRRKLTSKYGKLGSINSAGLKVYTTMDYDLQKTAQKALMKGILDLDKRQGYRGVTRHLEADDVDSFVEVVADDPALKELKLNKVYNDLAVVTKVDDKKKNIHIKLGKHDGVISLKGFKGRVPSEKSPYYYVVAKKPSKEFKVGDVVDVKVSDIKIAHTDKKEHAYKFSLYQVPIGQAALVSVDVKTGFVKTMVGGYDFNTSEFNRAVQAKRLPGSAFKPVVYAAAFDSKPKNGKYYTPSRIMYDTARVYEDGKWKPRNYGNKWKGKLPLRIALAKSVNTIAVDTLTDIGVNYFVDYCKDLGIEAKINRDPTSALGSSAMDLMELTTVYGIFASGGLRVEPVYITKVVDRDGNILEEWIPYELSMPEEEAEPTDEEEVIDMVEVEAGEIEAGEIEPEEKAEKDDPRRVMDAGTAYLVTSILQSVIKEGTGWRVRKEFGKRPLGGKTGTTNNCIDAWFMGFSPDIVTGVWVGVDKEKSLGASETGSRAAAPIWVDYMREALKDKPVTNFKVPNGIEFTKVDVTSGMLAKPGTADARFECFKKGTAPMKYTSDAVDNFSIIDVEEDASDKKIRQRMLIPRNNIDNKNSSVVKNTDDEEDELMPSAFP